MMGRAVRLAAKGFPAPNPHVGCVITRDDMVVGEGFHDYAGGPHTEIVALRQAGEAARGGTAYVTLEPCNGHGRAGPCSVALIQAGVSRVVYAVSDPNPLKEGGATRLREAGVDVDLLETPAAEKVNEVWLTAMRRKRPYVVLKAAIGMDGRLAMPDGRSKWITGAKARSAGMRLRADMGAVLVGARTMIQDNPRLSARVSGLVNPVLRVVMASRDLVLDGRRVMDEPGEIVFVPEDAEVALTQLWERGVTSVLVEGGAATHARFLKAGMVDRIELFVAPRILGAGPVWTSGDLSSDPLGESLDWELVRTYRLGDDIRLTYRRRVGHKPRPNSELAEPSPPAPSP